MLLLPLAVIYVLFAKLNWCKKTRAMVKSMGFLG